MIMNVSTSSGWPKRVSLFFCDFLFILPLYCIARPSNLEAACPKSDLKGGKRLSPKEVTFQIGPKTSAACHDTRLPSKKFQCHQPFQKWLADANGKCFSQAGAAKLDQGAERPLVTVDEAKYFLRVADAVCFDVDSTACLEESIDVLAELADVGDEVAALTTRGMDGSITFQEALSQRLQLIRPSRALVAKCLRERPPQLSPRMGELVATLRARNVDVFLVSGGFRQVINDVAKELGLDAHANVFANTLLFDAAGEYQGFDETEFTCSSGGKSRVIAHLKDLAGYKVVVHVGDGATDLEARPPADAVIGYGGGIVRPNVLRDADWFVHDFQELIDVLQAD